MGVAYYWFPSCFSAITCTRRKPLQLTPRLRQQRAARVLQYQLFKQYSCLVDCASAAQYTPREREQRGRGFLCTAEGCDDLTAHGVRVSVELAAICGSCKEIEDGGALRGGQLARML